MVNTPCQNAGKLTAQCVHRLTDFRTIYAYQGEGTCAADGMCQEKCPVKINTGELIKSIRAEQMKDMKTASGGAMVHTWAPCSYAPCCQEIKEHTSAVSSTTNEC